MKKLISVLAGAVLLFSSASSVSAQLIATDYHLGTSTAAGANGTIFNDISAPPFDNSTMYIMGFNRTTGFPELWHANQGFFLSGTQLDIVNLPQTAVIGLDDNINSYNMVKFPFLYSNLATATSSISTLSTNLSSLSATVAGLGTPTNIMAFMGNNASTSPYIASSTQNGFLSIADKVKIDALGNAWISTSTTRSIVTGTGATGFQVSSTSNATAKYNVKITTTASIAGNADGYIALEIAPTNSATSTNWIEEGRCGNSQALTLAITLQSVQGTSCQLVADIPAGYYAKLRSVTTTGTVSFAFISDRETLK